MRIIAQLAEFVRDEAKGARQYAKMAVKLRTEHKEWKELSDLIYNMANTEVSHLDSVHTWLVKFIEKERKERTEPIPQGMLDVWSWQHEKMLEEMAETKAMLQSYAKMQ